MESESDGRRGRDPVSWADRRALRPRLAVGASCAHGHRIVEPADLYTAKNGQTACRACMRQHTQRQKELRQQKKLTPSAESHISINGVGQHQSTAAQRARIRVEMALDVHALACAQSVARQGM